ncbi:response regulator [Pseudonocardia sp. TRM90224]|uniref:response regulator n=1 Tax=Pseudonocardia sp. TRM90224 TaxID=2812678 RepID=UPI001E3332D9|nr:response regulator transcription factor [Pseudonocardia sp. TRM90224]
MVSVLLVDDQPMLRLGFRAVLDGQPDIEVVGEAGNGVEALTLTSALAPDVVLMDVRMPVMDGIEATRRIVASGSRSRVLVLTTFDLDEYVFAALRAGASGFLIKDALPAELVGGVRVVAAGDAAVAPGVTRRLIETFVEHLPVAGAPNGTDPRIAELTSREREVLVELAHGRSNREIGERVFIAESTVKVHVGRMLTKLGLRDRAQAIVFAYEHGIVRPGDA